MDHTLSGRLWHRCEQFGAEPARALLGPLGAASWPLSTWVVKAKAAVPACATRPWTVACRHSEIVDCARPLADALELR